MRIVGLGSHLPSRVVHNDELASRLDTTDEWIRSRTGITQRHWAAPEEATSDLAIAASVKAIAAAGIDAADLGAVVVCTTTPDRTMPGTAPMVATRVGARGSMAVDVHAACTGWLHGLELAASLVAVRQQPALVVGADTFTRFIDPDDRSTAILFGDGAGAAVLCPDPRAAMGPFVSGNDGDREDLLWFETGGSRLPSTPQLVAEGRHLLTMQGREIYRHAVERMAEDCLAVLRVGGHTIDDVDLLVAHQANTRIIEAVGRRIGATVDQVHVTVDRHGNTSAASIPLALDDAVSTGRVHDDDLVLLTAFGAGLTHGAGLVTWSP